MWGPFIVRTASAPLRDSACAGIVAAGASRSHSGRGFYSRWGSGAWFALRICGNAPGYARRVSADAQGWRPNGLASALSALLPGQTRDRAPLRPKAPPCVPALLPPPLLLKAVSARGPALGLLRLWLPRPRALPPAGLFVGWRLPMPQPTLPRLLVVSSLPFIDERGWGFCLSALPCVLLLWWRRVRVLRPRRRLTRRPARGDPRPALVRLGGPPPLLAVPAPYGRAPARWRGLRESGVPLRGAFFSADALRLLS
jgi:hypothetical protein